MAAGPAERISSFDALRTEIIEAQKARTDLIKYKLVVAAILGAVALGIGPAAGSDGLRSQSLTYVVGIIPLVSLYVDSVCRHNDIRILLIGSYLRSEESPYRPYEQLVKGCRHSFSLERVSLDLSTLVVSTGILILGLWHLVVVDDIDSLLVGIELMSGMLGVVGTEVLRTLHKAWTEAIDDMDGRKVEAESV